jgi:hypothetical protein
MFYSTHYVYTKVYSLFPTSYQQRIKTKRGEKVSEHRQITENLLKLFQEIASREKKKAVEANDYGTAFVLAILEGILKETSISALR